MANPKRRTRVLTRNHSSGEIRLPLIELQGAKDGPTLTISAGIHGCEYAGVVAAVTLGRTLDPAQLTGVVNIIPYTNLPGFLGRTEVLCPVDGNHLGRAFPGDPNGSYTASLADLIWTEVGNRSDYLIDQHGGDIFEELIPYVPLTVSADAELTERSRAMARASGLPCILEMRSRARPQDPLLSLTAMALQSGAPAIVTEAGGEGVLRKEDVDLHIRSTRNIMHHLGMINDPAPPVDPARELPGDFWRIKNEGLVTHLVKLGDEVRKGDRIGIVSDWFGEPIEAVIAPADAWIIAVVTTPAARRDAIIYQVGLLG